MFDDDKSVFDGDEPVEKGMGEKDVEYFNIDNVVDEPDEEENELEKNEDELSVGELDDESEDEIDLEDEPENKTLAEERKRITEQLSANPVEYVLMSREEFDNVDKTTLKGKKIGIADPSLDTAGQNKGFTSGDETDFGWRKLEGSFSLKFRMFFKSLFIADTWRNLGRGIARAWNNIFHRSRSNDIELIYNGGSYVDSDRGGGELKVDPKKQEVTSGMVMRSIKKNNRISFLDDDLESAKNKLLNAREDMYKHVLGGGNPFAAYECFLDKNALREGIYTYDYAKIAKFKRGLTDEKLENVARKELRSQEKYLKKHDRLVEADEKKVYIDLSVKSSASEKKNEIASNSQKVEEVKKEKVEIDKEKVEVVGMSEKDQPIVENVPQKDANELIK